MSLLVLMYHHAEVGKYGNDAMTLDAHFAFIARHCHCVLPGDPLAKERLNVCISFDDGYVDFYTVVYPLLKKHDLRAILAVVPAFVQERIDLPMPARLAAWSNGAVAHGGYCTWNELKEMSDSGLVLIAGHGFTHVRLDVAGSDLHTEIVVPQTVLSARLGKPVECFVLPYGRFSPAALERAKQHYRFVFRIGGADNRDWNAGLIYRVDADQMRTADSHFSVTRRATYRLRRHWNILRGR